MRTLGEESSRGFRSGVLAAVARDSDRGVASISPKVNEFLQDSPTFQDYPWKISAIAASTTATAAAMTVIMAECVLT